jgi:hypothetical protein
MYLKGRRFLWNINDHADTQIANHIQGQFPELQGYHSHWGEDKSVVREITIDVGYWRKANAIHAWFVRNVQDGVDECQTSQVSREHLQTLRDLCQRVLDFRHLANELLPTQSGFFFGSTDYDESFIEDLKSTIEIIDRALALPTSWTFEYHASW